MKTNLIIEIGQAHEGSLGIAHSYIDAISKTGAQTIKFQTHIAEAESSPDEQFRVKFSYEDASRYDYWQRMEFTPEQWAGLKSHCEDVGLEFLSSPFSIAAVNLLENLGVNRYKIGSGETNNDLMLDYIKSTKKPILISSGMSTELEVEKMLKKFEDCQIGLFQCTTMYPTPLNLVGINIIEEWQKKYPFPIGLSDHSGSIYPSLLAVAKGAKMLECHAVFDKQMFGPDSTSSLDIKQIKSLVAAINEFEIMIDNPLVKSENENSSKMKNLFQKSLALSKNKNAGDIIEFSDLESKKPANMGISAEDYKKVVGKKINKNKQQWDFIKMEDLCDE
jgi:N,N'-diacetyllegionaminate synthase